MKFPIVIKQSPLVLIKRIMEVELLATLFLFAISFLTNYEALYEVTFSRFLRYDVFLFVTGAILQLAITILTFFIWHAEEYRIKENEIIHRSGIFFTKERSILLKNVTMVEYKRSLMEFLLSYGTIILTSNGDKKKFAIRSIEAAEIYANVIKNIINKPSEKINELQKKLSILDLVLEGEHSKLEFKQTFRWDTKQQATSKILEKSAIKTLGAFLNSLGGNLIIGVTDSGKVYGLQDDYMSLIKKDRDGFENHFNQVFNQLIGAEFRQYVTVSFQTIEEKDVCLVEVVQSPEPVYVAQGNDVEFFIRTGNTTSPLSVKETHSYIESHWKKENELN
jgi:membrane protein YdbS with pleckstrin-like domain